MAKHVIFLNLIMFLMVSWASAQPSRVIFLGESHTSESDHAGQLEVLKSLEGAPLILAAEMFTSRSERALMELTETPLSEELWKQEWGHPYELYAPIWEWAVGRVQIAPLRPDPSFTKRVKEGGPAVAVAEIDTLLLGPEPYRQSLSEIFAAHLPPDQEMSDEMLNSYFLIQCFWDEYMAWRISRLADQYPEHRIAVLVGYGHLHPEFGIPARLKRRRRDLRYVNIAFSEERREGCDLLWTLRER